MGAPSKAPFPWYGGKSKWAARVWEVLGQPATYIEPFAGSLAILLANPHGRAKREIVSDADGHICNFWRAVRWHPDATAEAAEWPSSHLDLTARHRWLIQWGRENVERLRADPNWCDVQAAGWWVWGLSNWIGGGWCSDPETWFGVTPSKQTLAERGFNTIPNIQQHGVRQGIAGLARPPEEVAVDQIPYKVTKGHQGQGVQQGIPRLAKDRMPRKSVLGFQGHGCQQDVAGLSPPDFIPKTNSCGTASGVQQARTEATFPREQIPRVPNWPVGNGVTQQRTESTFPRDGMPALQSTGDGRGIQQTTKKLPSEDDWVRPALVQWFRELSQRLRAVTLICRPWDRFMSPSLLGQTQSHDSGIAAIVLDPPYLVAGRSENIYSSDEAGASDDAARSAWEWAVAHGDDPGKRIVYFAHEGDFEVPAGWTVETMTFAAIKRSDRQHRRDAMYVSPHCLRESVRERQTNLLFNEGDQP